MTKYLGKEPFSVGGYARSVHPYTTLVWDFRNNSLTITTNVEPPRLFDTACGCKRERLEEPELHWRLTSCAKHADDYLKEYG